MTNFERIKNIEFNGFKPFANSSIDNMVDAINRINCNHVNMCKACAIKDIDDQSSSCKDKIKRWLESDASGYSCYYLEKDQLNKMKELLMENEFDELNEFFNNIKDQKIYGDGVCFKKEEIKNENKRFYITEEQIKKLSECAETLFNTLFVVSQTPEISKETKEYINRYIR